tara:strand:- start:6932 stop:8062 length:1131 start_codon:yes stop_codon:yes gene_type:complete
MSPRTVLLIGVALISGLGTVYMARLLLTAPDARLSEQTSQAVDPQKAPVTRILVAARDLPTGALVRAEDLAFRAWPEVAEGEDVYLLEEQTSLDDYLGAVVRRALTAGDPVTRRRLVKPGEQGFLAAVLEPNTRAVSVPINGVTGVAGLVFPGDRVDLILTHTITLADDANITERRAAETVLENVRILAIDQSTDDQSDEPKVGKTATLEVLPQQAERVILLAELGQLSLSLRALAWQLDVPDGRGPQTDPGASVESSDQAPAARSMPGGLAATAAAQPSLIPAVALSPDRQRLLTQTSVARAQPVLPEPAPRRVDALTTSPAARLAGPHLPQNPRPFTWDSDVSRVLPAPVSQSAKVQTVRVMRGTAIEEKNFKK